MKEFFNSNSWIVISAIISVFGLIGTILGIYQYLKSSKQFREYTYLFKVAGQHVDLEDKKNQINDYENQISHMQKTINEKIPEEAKRIALKGILDNELQSLSSTYTKVKSLQSELEILTSENNLENEEIMKNVTEVIEPAYSRKRSDSLFSTAFYLVSIFSSFASMILPYFIYQIVIFIVLLFQLIIGIRKMSSFLKLYYTRKELTNILYRALVVGAIASLVLSLLIILFLLYLLTMGYFVEKFLFFIFSAVTFGIHLILGFIYFLKKNKITLIIWFLLSLVSLMSMVSFIIFSEPLFVIVGAFSVSLNVLFLFTSFRKK